MLLPSETSIPEDGGSLTFGTSYVMGTLYSKIIFVTC